ALWWLAAVIAVLVPLLHWVLVPTLALLGPILALRTFARDRSVCGGSGLCPSCGDALRFGGASRPESFTHACPTCHQSLDTPPCRSPQRLANHAAARTATSRTPGCGRHATRSRDWHRETPSPPVWMRPGRPAVLRPSANSRSCRATSL